jgi:hypothetical protein
VNCCDGVLQVHDVHVHMPTAVARGRHAARDSAGNASHANQCLVTSGVD